MVQQLLELDTEDGGTILVAVDVPETKGMFICGILWGATLKIKVSWKMASKQNP